MYAHDAELVGRVDRLEEVVGVRREEGNPIALLDAEVAEGVGESIHAFGELAVRVLGAVVRDDAGEVTVQLFGAIQVVEGRHLDVHDCSLPMRTCSITG